MPHINGESIEAGTCRLLNRYRTAREDGVTSGKFHFPPGAVLYSKIRPYLMKAARVPFEGVCSADVYAFHIFSPFIDPNFFAYSLIAAPFTAYANRLSGRTLLAAGPWSQQLTHKAIFAATQQNWLRWDNGQLVPGRSFQRGLAHAATLPDDARPKVQKTVSDLSKCGDHGLERWGTVLMAARDLQAANKPVSHAAIQHEIDQWPGKRSKEIFTEESVEKTIDAMARHGWLKDLQ